MPRARGPVGDPVGDGPVRSRFDAGTSSPSNKSVARGGDPSHPQGTPIVDTFRIHGTHEVGIGDATEVEVGETTRSGRPSARPGSWAGAPSMAPPTLSRTSITTNRRHMLPLCVDGRDGHPPDSAVGRAARSLPLRRGVLWRLQRSRHTGGCAVQRHRLAGNGFGHQRHRPLPDSLYVGLAGRCQAPHRGAILQPQAPGPSRGVLTPEP